MQIALARVYAIQMIQWKDMNANAVMVSLDPIVKKSMHAIRVLAQITEFVWIYRKDMKEMPTSVCVHTVSTL